MSRLIVLLLLCFPNLLFASDFKTITFPSKDGLTVSADVYMSHPKNAPFIVLFHQAQWSRGEYREIAPKLTSMGFNSMAVDQRSGSEVNGVFNETFKEAEKAGKQTTYLDALQDMEAAIEYARTNYASGKLILWGSSYSASLVVKLAGDNPGTADGVVAFAPGEYFEKSGKGNTFVTQSAKAITCPVFITSARSEKELWFSIFEATQSKNKVYFIPKMEGEHGSKALWENKSAHKEYWAALIPFLKQFTAR
jgi:dienelactone hydrolase